jgi:hypothetical protein
MPEQVRPTKRMLESASIPVPDISQNLGLLDHVLVDKARATVESIEAGSGKRVVSIKDRVLFKVKTDDWRAVLIDVGSDLVHLEEKHADCIRSAQAWWWIGDAGHRKGDSKQSDFYARLKVQAFAGGKNTCDSSFLLPSAWDAKRLDAELALAAITRLQASVRNMAARSLASGDPQTEEIGNAMLRIRVLMKPDGIVYIAIGAMGMADPKFFALVLTALPGVRKEDWEPEPGAGLGIAPEAGEILWSAILSNEAQAELAVLGS